MLKDKVYRIIATGFCVGKIPFAPGTWGSLLALVLWVVINYYLLDSFEEFLFEIVFTWLIIIFITFFIGIKSSEYFCQKYKKKDAQEVVIDEICGQWIALFVVLYFTLMVRVVDIAFLSFNLLISSSLLTLVLFRVFDIYKPLIIGKIDQNIKGGLGVMLDDVVAGIFAGIFSFLIIFLSYFDSTFPVGSILLFLIVVGFAMWKNIEK